MILSIAVERWKLFLSERYSKISEKLDKRDTLFRTQEPCSQLHPSPD